MNVEGKKNSNKAQMVADLSDLRYIVARINFPDIFPWSSID